ncbi:hypothetical protein [Streptomyces sp. NPDC058683]|uniref:hypothetical protein n=1 Tax=Streptomyces sp. NPDC058683 TaxID=3346597 RepID=UPI00364BFE94
MTRPAPVRTGYELLDTGVFEENRCFDVVVEYAKAGPGTGSSRSPRTTAAPRRPCCAHQRRFVRFPA